jgi:hypothetical protein
VHRLLPVIAAVVVAQGAAGAAVKPDALATTSGGGTASVSSGAWDRWRIVVTTKPSGLKVLLAIRGERAWIVKGPAVRTEDCPRRCAIKVTARLWQPDETSPAGTVSLALYKA